jgi:arylsulfatase A-like enzyme
MHNKPRKYGSAVLVVLSLLITAIQIPMASPSSGANRRPNILIIVTDDQRGGLQVMPSTQRWIKNRGVRFRDAFVTTPLCCPSRASILTGRYAHNHHVFSKVGERDLIQESTVEYYLQQAGYETAMFGKYLNGWDLTQPPPYFDQFAMTNTSRHYYNGIFNVNGTVKTIPRYNTRYISRKAKRFLLSAPAQNRPWFLYLAPDAPHGPFTPQSKYADVPVTHWDGDPAVFEKDRSDKPAYVQEGHAGIRGGRRTRAKQFRTLMSIDDLVANVFHTLRALGELKHTLVIMISDNGLMWGEHGLKHKGVPYEQAIQVPMLARWPSHFVADSKDNRIVANIDIAPTVLEAARLTANPAYPMDGTSLLDTASRRDRILTEYFHDFGPIPRDWASIRTDAYKYTEYYTDDHTTITFREYYDLTSDPWELHNLLGDGDPSNDPDVAALHLQLAQDRTCEGTVGANPCP